MALIRFRPAPLAPLLLTLLIAGCGTGGAPANGSAATDTSGGGSIFGGSLKPGLYEVVQTGDAPGTEKECLTAEQLAKGEIAPSDSLQEGWRFVRNNMSGGRYDVEAAGPSNAKIVSSGTYDSTSYEGDWVMSYDEGGKAQTIKIHAKARHISDSCEQKDKEEA